MSPHTRFDLQSHSRHSDGALTPTEVVGAAARSGVELLALTDHDTVAGVEEAIVAGRQSGLTVVPAVELSALHDRHDDLHILGYGIDHRHQKLLDALARFRADRSARADRMTHALRQEGFGIAEGILAAQREAGRSIGRPHLARAVFEERSNTERLRNEGLERPEQVLEAYLLPGRPAYRGRTIPSVQDAIALIHDAAGIAIWAHPFWDVNDPGQAVATLERFARWGIDGVETFYVTHDETQTRLLDDARRRLDLLSTGSSDFHGPDHAIFSRFLAYELHGCMPHLGPIAGGPPALRAVDREQLGPPWSDRRLMGGSSADG